MRANHRVFPGSVKNLKEVKNHHLGFLFTLELNRLISVEKGAGIQIQELDIPDERRKSGAASWGW